MRRHAVIPVLALIFQLAVMGPSVPPAFAQGDANGGPICTAANDQSGVKVVDDGAHGMYVLWSDARVTGHTGLYLQRIVPQGYPAPGWPMNGIQISADVVNTARDFPPDIGYDMV